LPRRISQRTHDFAVERSRFPLRHRGVRAANCGREPGVRILRMRTEEIEAEALKLDPQARARLAKKLLESLETLSDQENERLWAEEADRRDADWDSAPGSARPAADVLRDARAKLK
jgi:Putative addiction module component